MTVVLLVLTAIYPAGVFLAACFGYRFVLRSVPAFAIAIAVLSLCATIMAFVFKNTPESKVVRVLSALLTPLSLVNAMLCIVRCPEAPVAAGALLSAGCAFCLTIKLSEPSALKIVALVLSALMVLPVGFFSVIALLLGNFGQRTVVKTIESPDGTYYAQIIDSDQGALGGNTLVDVCEKSPLDLLLFRVEKKSQRVYSGDWGAYAEMQVFWKGNRCLVIDSVEYKIGE